MVRASSSPFISREHSVTGEKLSLLAVFAHPDDESFGPAGTLAKYASEGVQVSLAMATREETPSPIELTRLQPEEVRARDRVCSCRTTGIRRACLLDSRPGELIKLEHEFIEAQLVRLIREIQPQVIVTFGPDGLLASDGDHKIISAAVTAAFHDAGDASKFEQHYHEGLGAYAPQKLYYCVLPQSLVTRWGVPGLQAVPDSQVTTVLDVSSYSEAMTKALYCQRNHMLDSIRWLTEDRRVAWDAEYYMLVESRLNKKPRRERDLFAGLR
ncbi:MAG: PIG-L family deacetylase [Chloroflexota bacterium]|nr:PIG-L family deacetylase [Chloroflexota bacterium]